ncbi:hypothetical protein KHM83_01070 [Fusibacter paucivorans]|uniref:Uncharacterized protein n=1 Tax=Fusibacter paucivorans TaxID=76009 RepID=A0ABS5PJI3_9FIRM|nr:hypothetical protein [Fusibacter paucivorans]MBS7525260.1 hypothetical protein [Fusibacter paucivorans]
MKKKVFGLIIIVVLLANFLDFAQYKISRAIVNHVEAGNFINDEDIDLRRVTMLHWFSGEVQLYAENDTPITFVQFGYPKRTWLYANRSLIAQNESRDYPAYQGTDYLFYAITPDFY